jgi:hypothetical protein
MLRSFVAVLSLACLSACGVAPHSVGEPPQHRVAGAAQPAPAAVDEAPDASYDWHGLILVPFGTRLQESPVPLHEVLLFHDAAQDAAGTEERDCYTIESAPPQFVGRQASDYLLCFDHDRLNRIEATVRLPADGATSIFAAACARWLKTSAPASQTSGSCDGRDGATGFSARFGGEPEQSAPTLSISLFNVADP